MSLRRNAIANYLGQGWTTVMGLAFIPLYIHYLGMEAYGLIGIFALLQSWLSLLDLGMTPSISRELARFTAGGHGTTWIRDLLRTIEVSSLVVAVLVALGIWAGSSWLATHWLHAERLPPSIVARAFGLMGLVAAMRLLENIYRSALVGLQRQTNLNVIISLAATLRGAGAAVVLRWVSPTIEAFFLWQGAISALTLIALGATVHRSIPRADRRARFSLEAIEGVWRFATGTVLLTLLGFVLSQSDKVILSSILTLKEFAVYSLAYTVASAVRLLAQPIDQAVYPRLTELCHRQDEAGLAQVYHKAAQYNAVLMGGIGLFLALFGERILVFWTRDPALARSTYALLWILIIGMLLNALMNGPYYLQLAAGWTGLLIRVTGTMVVVFVPTIYLLTKRFGVVGAAVAWVLVNVVYLATVAQLMHRRLLRTEMRAWFLDDLAAPLLAAVATGLVLRSLLSFNVGIVPASILLLFCLACMMAAGSLAAAQVRRQLRATFRLVTANAP